MEKRVPRKTDIANVLNTAVDSFNERHEHIRDEWYILRSHSQRDDYDGSWEVTWKEAYGPFNSKEQAENDYEYLTAGSKHDVEKYKVARKRHYMLTPSPYPVAYWS